jgi:hypothetical protein
VYVTFILVTTTSPSRVNGVVVTWNPSKVQLGVRFPLDAALFSRRKLKPRVSITEDIVMTSCLLGQQINPCLSEFRVNFCKQTLLRRGAKKK